MGYSVEAGTKRNLGQMRIRTKYDFGDTVYLKTDGDQSPRMVTGVILSPGQVMYELSQGVSNSRYYDFEISSSINLVLKTTD